MIGQAGSDASAAPQSPSNKNQTNKVNYAGGGGGATYVFTVSVRWPIKIHSSHICKMALAWQLPTSHYFLEAPRIPPKTSASLLFYKLHVQLSSQINSEGDQSPVLIAAGAGGLGPGIFIDDGLQHGHGPLSQTRYTPRRFVNGSGGKKKKTVGKIPG